MHEESASLLYEDYHPKHDNSEKGAAWFQRILPNRSSHKLISWATTVIVVCAIVDVLVLSYIYRLLATFPTVNDSASQLEIRSPYVGLSELYRSGLVKSASYEPITNVPRLAAQISRAEPDKVFPDDVHRTMSDHGMISPGDRHLQLSREISTVLQFRTLDFGFERCSLAIRLPSLEERLPNPEPYVFRGMGDSLQVNVWALETTQRPLDAQTLSSNRRPVRRDLLATLDVQPGVQVQLPDFHCPSGTFHAFEVTCGDDSSDECELDVWSNQNEPWGAFMYQFQTV